MFLPIEPIRKELIPYRVGKFDIFKIKGKLRHIKEKFSVTGFQLS